MKKAQVSFEFILLFTVLFFVFIIIVGVFPAFLDKDKSKEQFAQTLANDFKTRLITASLSVSDFRTQIKMPESINGISIEVFIAEDPENLLIIRDTNGNTLGSSFLPIIDVYDEIAPDGELFVIEKTGNTIKITREVA